MPHQADTLQQRSHRSFKQLKPLALIAAALLVVLLAGTGGYLLGSRNNQSNPSSLPLPSPQSTRTSQSAKGVSFRTSLKTISPPEPGVMISPAPTCDTTPRFVPASQSQRNTNMDANTWVTYDGTVFVGSSGEKPTPFSIQYPSSWDRVDNVLYPYGKPPENAPCGYYDPKVELGIGGFELDTEHMKEKIYPGGKAIFDWETLEEKYSLGHAIFTFKDHPPLIIRVKGIHPNESTIMQTIFDKMLSTVRFMN